MVARLQGADVILCQITSQPQADTYSVTLDTSDFTVGGLNQRSSVRPNRLFTADEGIIRYRAGHISDAKMNEVVDTLVAILRQR